MNFSFIWALPFSLRICLILSFAILVAASGQAQPIDSLVARSMCSCLQENNNHIEEDPFSTCLEQSFTKYENEILKYTKQKYHSSSYETGRKAGREIMNRLSVNMIYSCKAYFNLMDSVRNRFFYSVNADSVAQQLQTLNNLDTTRQTAEYYFSRGVLHFQLQSFDQAINDLDKPISKNVYKIESLTLKAWALELKKKYKEAVLLYDKLVQLTGKNEFRIFSAIVRQKQNGW